MSVQSKPSFGRMEPLSVAVSILLLAGAGVESTHFRTAPDATAYHKRVQGVADDIYGRRDAHGVLVPPLVKFGDWVGQDTPVDYTAVTILHPSVLVSRSFHNTQTPGSAGFLFVDCEDARDTIGHYPPICYPSQGWSLQLQTPKFWQLPHMVVHGMEYTFVRSVFDGSGTLIVDDFFILPGGGTNPDRDLVIKAAGDLQRRFYGVAQAQVVFDAQPSPQQRDQTFVDLVSPMENLIQSVEMIGPTKGAHEEAERPAVIDIGKGELQ